jgi:hypothetical protein
VLTTGYFGAANATQGTYHGPLDSEVISTATFGIGDAVPGVFLVPAQAKVLDDEHIGTTATHGTYHGPVVAEVLSTADFGVSPQTGSYQPVANTNVRLNTPVGVSPAVGTVVVPAATSVLTTTTVDNGSGTAISGTYHGPEEDEVLSTASFGVSPQTGIWVAPDVGVVRYPEEFGPSGLPLEGTCVVPEPEDVRLSTAVGVSPSAGSLIVPSVADVRLNTDVDTAATHGTLIVPAVTDVLDSAQVDTAATFGTYHDPETAEVLDTAQFGVAPQMGTFTPPLVGDVIVGAAGSVTGTYVEATEAQVEDGVFFGAGGTEYEGTFAGGIADGDIVAAAFVLTGHFRYVGDAEGTYHAPELAEVIYPAVVGTGTGTYYTVPKKDVRRGVKYGPNKTIIGSYGGGR